MKVREVSDITAPVTGRPEVSTTLTEESGRGDETASDVRTIEKSSNRILLRVLRADEGGREDLPGAERQPSLHAAQYPDFRIIPLPAFPPRRAVAFGRSPRLQWRHRGGFAPPSCARTEGKIG
jgi:hypothetical protein